MANCLPVGRRLVCPASRAALGRRAPDGPSRGTLSDDSWGVSSWGLSPADGQEGWASGWTVGTAARRQTFVLRPRAPLAQGELPEMRVPSAPTATLVHQPPRTPLTLGPGAHKVPGRGHLPSPAQPPPSSDRVLPASGLAASPVTRPSGRDPKSRPRTTGQRPAGPITLKHDKRLGACN